MERLTIPDEKIEGGVKRTVIDSREVKKNAMTIYWALKKYEDTGLTPIEIIRKHMNDKAEDGGWIPVEDRLPENGESVLCTDGEYIYLVEYDADLDAAFGDMDRIIAWQPLPEPYRPEN